MIEHLWTENDFGRYKVAVRILKTGKCYVYSTSEFISRKFQTLYTKTKRGMSSLNYLKRNSTLLKGL